MPWAPGVHLCVITARCKVKPVEVRKKTRFSERWYPPYRRVSERQVHRICLCTTFLCVWFLNIWTAPLWEKQKGSVCGPVSVLLQYPEKRNTALSGASLHTAYHSITSHAAWLRPMCKTAVEKASCLFFLIECPLRNVFSYSPHFYQKYPPTSVM